MPIWRLGTVAVEAADGPVPRTAPGHGIPLPLTLTLTVPCPEAVPRARQRGHWGWGRERGATKGSGLPSRHPTATMAMVSWIARLCW